MSCQHDCEKEGCIYTRGETKIKDLVLYTPLPELWEMFIDILELSPLDSYGFFTIQMADAYMRDIEIKINPISFWKTMKYFLYRMNKKVADKKRLANLRKG